MGIDMVGEPLAAGPGFHVILRLRYCWHCSSHGACCLIIMPSPRSNATALWHGGGGSAWNTAGAGPSSE